MQIVVTSFLDQLSDVLMKSRQLVSLLEKKDSRIFDSFVAWLNESIVILESFHNTHVSELVGIKAQFFASSLGVIEKERFEILNPTNSRSKRKIQLAVTAILINNAQKTLQEIYSTYSLKREEAEKVIRQVLMISLQKGTFYPIWNSKLSIVEKLKEVWNLFVNDPDIVQGTRQVLSHVHYVDAIRLLDELITEWKL